MAKQPISEVYLSLVTTVILKVESTDQLITSPENLLEMQNLRPNPRLIKVETLELGPCSLF